MFWYVAVPNVPYYKQKILSAFTPKKDEEEGF